MIEYRTYGSLDDRILKDRDFGFVGLNNRLRPDQLKEGILADSQNGRMGFDGQWSTRKGIGNIKAPLATGTTALTLPFFNIGTTLGDTDGITAAHGACGTQEITESDGTTVRRLIITLAGITASDVTAITVNTATGDEGKADVTSTLTGIAPTFTDGIHSIRAIAKPSSTSITFAVIDYTINDVTFSGGSAIIKNPALADTAVNEVYGSCIFSNPNANSESYIILAANTKAVAVKISDPSSTVDLPYIGAETISAPVEMIQAFNKLYIFRDGDTALSIDLAANNFAADQTAQVNSNALVVGKTYKIHTVGSQTWTNCGAADNSVGTIFVCTAVGDQTDAKATEILTILKVDEGDFTQPVTLVATVCDIDNNECTITASAAHGLKVGDVIFCTKQGDSTLITNQFTQISNLDSFSTVAESYTVKSVPSTTQFKFNVANSVADIADGSISTYPEFVREVSSSLGFTHMPAPKYGVYHQRRLAVPYRFDTLSSSITVTDRKIFDEVILSKILDTDTYDKRFGQFRFNAGMADFNVGMLSFSDDKLIVFNRNSIHQVTGQGKVETLSNQLLTDEVGLVAKNTIAQVGNQILFLSDNGVYGLTFIDRYNLRGTELPLSESIQKTIDRINKNAADKAVAVYFDNRYYIAVPVDGSPFNNAILIYNFLNKSWESVDSVNNTDFEFSNLLVAGSGLNKGVFIVNTDGGIHKLETEADGIDRVITQIGSSTTEPSNVLGSATTRMFTLGTIDRKRWKNLELHLESSADNVSDVRITGIAENPDSEPNIDLLTANDYLGENIRAGEDVSIRARIGNPRAYGLQIKIDTTLGLPTLRAVKVGASTSFRSITSVQ
jgi:hypothetical protein